MIIVADGPSASGKTTWCRKHFPDGFVEEEPETVAAPDLYADPAEVAVFWVERNIGRWRAALAIERRRGIGVCDSDPLKLYFSWALWKAGVISSGLFEIETPLYRRAIEEKQLGFADRVILQNAPIEELRKRSRLDSTRTRKRHEMYLSLVPWMTRWWTARARALPSTIYSCEHSSPELPRSTSFDRYDPTFLDALLDAL